MTLFGLPTLLLGAAAAGLAWRLNAERDRAARAEQAARAARARIENVDLARNRLLASMSHELRGPLSAVIGYQELLAEGIYGDLDPRSAEAVRRIGLSAHQLLALIDTVLDVARIQAGQAQRETATVRCDELLASVLDDARELATEREVTIESVQPGPTPAIVTDPRRLRQALDIAASAAIRASAGSTVTGLTAAGPDGSIVIRFLGTGIAPDTPIHAAGAPQPTNQPETAAAPDTRTPRGGGQALMRLGLAAALVHFLGGRLQLRAENDATTLSITLPRNPPEASADHP